MQNYFLLFETLVGFASETTKKKYTEKKEDFVADMS